MAMLIAGLLLFLGTHSVRLFADDWRARTIARLGVLRWRAAYSLLSVIGFVLLLKGYGEVRRSATVLWSAPAWGYDLAVHGMLFASLLMGAYFFRRSHIALAVRHPMLLAVIAWAAVHLCANASSADLLLFGGFLLWAAADLVAAARRPPAGERPAPSWIATLLGLIAGVAMWYVVGRWLHAWMNGISPLA